MLLKNKHIKNILFILLPLFLFIVFYNVGLAQDNPPSDLYPCDGPDCKFEDLLKLVSGVVGRLFTYALILSSIIFAYAGYLYLTSQNNPNQRGQANKIFQNVVIGLAIMMLAWVLVNLVLTTFVSSEYLDSSPFKTVQTR